MSGERQAAAPLPAGDMPMPALIPRLAVAMLCVAAGRAFVAAAEPEPCIGIAEAIRRGVDQDAASTVRVRGVVTLAYSDRSDFAIQDATGGIWATTYGLPTGVAASDARSRLRAGDEVEVAGGLDPGGYAPRILARDVRIVGDGGLPEPLAADLPRLFRGGDNCRRVAVEGIVRAVRDDGRHEGVILDVDSRQVLARLPGEMPHESALGLVDATVRLVGVTAAVRNARGEFLCPSLWIGSAADIQIIQAAPGPPFEAPFVSLGRIGAFSGDPLPRHRIRTRGTVSLALPGNILFLQEEAGGLRIEASSAFDAEPGDVVEVAGFLDMSRQIVGLTEAVVRRIGRKSVPEPRAIPPDKIAAINAAARYNGQIATPGDFDGCLVTFPARVVEVKSAATKGGHLVLSAGETTLSAILDGGNFARLASIRPGSEVRVTGVIDLQLLGDEGLQSVAADPVMQRMSLLLRSADDVVVIWEPSWWTPKRLAALLGAVAAVLAAVLVWVALLRREVRATTLRLTDEMQSRRNAAVEFQATLRERNRLAANLHDTLLQTLRGIDFQLGACQAQGARPGVDPWEHLDVARKMVNHAAEELRGSVWALRTMPVAGKSFGESLEAIARQTGHGHAEHVAVRVAGESFEVPQFVAGNLLLVVQEAIHNALAHADAGQIDVEADFDAASGTVELTVVDDGHGFTPGTEAGTDQGHFGLTGMRERIQRLGGEFSINSRPGVGTTVRMKVRKRDYDTKLDVPEEPGAGHGGDPADLQRAASVMGSHEAARGLP